MATARPFPAHSIEDRPAWPRPARGLGALARRMAGLFSTQTRLETACLGIGLAGLGMALGVTLGQASMRPLVMTEQALRKAIVAADFDGSVCPDGWAADHALLLGRSEAEITAWYLQEAMGLSDRQVIMGVGTYLAHPRDFRRITGDALTRNQILLCIAETRRLTVPERELIPPSLRG